MAPRSLLASTADTELDNGPRTERSAPQRLCAVSRTVRPVGELIRFVVSPHGEVVPDKDISAVPNDADLEALGVDSMALVDFVLELERETGITVADQDILGLTSIDAIVDYVTAAQASGP